MFTLRSSIVRRVGSLLMAAALALNTACHVYVPLQTAPSPGMEIALDLNDRGRAELAGSIGPAVQRVVGVLVAATDSVYELNVTSVTYFSGAAQEWSGERLRVRTDYVSQTRERKLSRSRSLLVGAGSAAAIVAAIVTANLVGGASPIPTPTEPPPAGHQ